MSNLFRNLAARGGLSFAHLGRSARAEDDREDDDSGKGKRSKRAEDDDQQQDRDDGDSKRSKRAEGGESDDDDDDSGKGKRSKRAEDDDQQQDRDDGDSKRSKRAEGGESDDDDDDSGKGKRGKRAEDDDEDERAEDDDDDEEEMRGKSAAARARRRERARCAAIFACKGAGRNTELAANLAFESTMTRSEAIAVLDKTRGSANGSQQRRNPNLGGGDAPRMSEAQAVEASWDTAFQKAGAKARRGR